MSYDRVFRHGTVVTPAGRCLADVGVRDGRIAAIGDLGAEPAAETVDCRGLHLLPGVIDTQVHFREPGLEHKEDLATGTAAAALGGVVAVFEMPNTKPSTDRPELVVDKLRRAEGRTWVDHAFYAGGSVDNATAVPAMEAIPGCAGIKVFMGSSTGSLLVADDAHLELIVQRLRRRMAVHCEDELRLEERKAQIPAGATAHWHPVWRDEESALRATRRLIALAERHRKRVHVLHVSTADELAPLRAAKDWVSCEVLVNHLTLAAPDCYDRLGSLAQMNPPVRDERHRAALWAAVRDGTFDVLATDHAPHTREEKAKPYPQTPSGMPGVQTLVPLMLDHVAAGRLTLERFVELTSSGPQRLFGLAGKGRLAPGYDADLTIVDLGARHEIRNQDQASRCGWTPFDGMTVTGWPLMTVVRGAVVMRDGQLLGAPGGRPCRFHEAP
ncbi:MAG: dihydroorotase [Planctomycetes bacterium]|nr:dihydroorotase [Planctomycetota bacterium]